MSDQDTELSAAIFVSAMSTLRSAVPDVPPQILADGSRVFFTTQRDEKDMLHFVTLPNGKFGWVMARDVANGAVLFDELPTVYVATFDNINGRLLRRLYPAEEPLVSVATMPDASLEWSLTYQLLTTHTSKETATILTTMLIPGADAITTRMRAAIAALPEMTRRIRQLKQELDATAPETDDHRKLKAVYTSAVDEFTPLNKALAPVYRWVGAIRKKAPSYEIDDIMRVHGIVSANMLELATPLSHYRYGAALYRNIANMYHSCAPSARATCGEGGKMYIEALGPLAAGTVITLNRFLGANSMIRCINTAPMVLRDAYDNLVGLQCSCSECVTCATWLRTSANGGEDKTVDDVARVAKVVEETWMEPSEPIAAFLATLKEDSVLPIMMTRPIILFRTPRAIADMTEDVSQSALIDLFGKEETSVGTVALASLVASTAWNTTHTFYASFHDSVVDAALIHLRTHSATCIGYMLNLQGASEALISRRLLDWHMHIEQLTVSVLCTRHIRNVSAIEERADREAKLQVACRETNMGGKVADLIRSALAATTNFDTVIRHLHAEQLFAPHVGAVMSLFEIET